MNEENAKIAKIKKGCHAGKVVSNVIFIVAIVGFIASVASGIWILAMGKDFDVMISQAESAGYIESTNNPTSFSVLEISSSKIAQNITSDVPAIQEALNDHPQSILYGTWIIVMSFCIIIAAVLIKLIGSVFAMAEKEDTPFTDKIRKRVTIILGIMSALLIFTTGAIYGVLGFLITWVVNLVLDYGKTLQIQSDETL